MNRDFTWEVIGKAAVAIVVADNLPILLGDLFRPPALRSAATVAGLIRNDSQAQRRR